MKTILLLRHAKSSWRDSSLDDFDRPLAKRGRRAAEVMARHLASCGARPDQILCSPSRRTRETLDRVEGSFGVPIPVRFERAIYHADSSTLLRRLRRLSVDLGTVMVVGHNPGLERLTALLAGSGDAEARQRLALKFPTGALAILEANIETWLDLNAGGAALLSFVQPRDFDGS